MCVKKSEEAMLSCMFNVAYVEILCQVYSVDKQKRAGSDLIRGSFSILAFC